MQELSSSRTSFIFIALALLAVTAAIHLCFQTDQIRREEKSSEEDMDRHQNRKKKHRKIRKKAALATKSPLSKCESETNIITEETHEKACAAIAVVENENDYSCGPCQENGQNTKVSAHFHFL